MAFIVCELYQRGLATRQNFEHIPLWCVEYFFILFPHKYLNKFDIGSSLQFYHYEHLGCQAEQSLYWLKQFSSYAFDAGISIKFPFVTFGFESQKVLPLGPPSESTREYLLIYSLPAKFLVACTTDHYFPVGSRPTANFLISSPLTWLINFSAVLSINFASFQKLIRWNSITHMNPAIFQVRYTIFTLW